MLRLDRRNLSHRSTCSTRISFLVRHRTFHRSNSLPSMSEFKPVVLDTRDCGISVFPRNTKTNQFQKHSARSVKTFLFANRYGSASSEGGSGGARSQHMRHDHFIFQRVADATAGQWLSVARPPRSCPPRPRRRGQILPNMSSVSIF